MSEQDKDVELIRKHATELGEHFDSVQIFATRHESGEKDGTITVQLGIGNWFARYGHVRDWIIKQDERARINERKPDSE